MAFPARKFEMEDSVEERLARLEVTTEHIQSDVTEIKKDLKHIDAKIDENTTRLDSKIDESAKRLDAKIDESTKRLDAKIDALKDQFSAFEGKMRDSFASLRVGRAMDKVWALLAMGALLGVMAHGFKWI